SRARCRRVGDRGRHRDRRRGLGEGTHEPVRSSHRPRRATALADHRGRLRPRDDRRDHGRTRSRAPGRADGLRRRAGRRRTGTAVAAATLALTAPVAIAAYTLSDEAYNNAQVSLGRDMLVLDSAETSPLSTDLSAALRRAIPGSVVALQRYVLFPPSKTSDKTQTDLASVDDPPLPSRDDSGQPGVFSSSLVVVGDETLLRAMHAEQAIPALEAGRVIDVGLHPVRTTLTIRSGSGP